MAKQYLITRVDIKKRISSGEYLEVLTNKSVDYLEVVTDILIVLRMSVRVEEHYEYLRSLGMHDYLTKQENILRGEKKYYARGEM